MALINRHKGETTCRCTVSSHVLIPPLHVISTAVCCRLGQMKLLTQPDSGTGQRHLLVWFLEQLADPPQLQGLIIRWTHGAQSWDRYLGVASRDSGTGRLGANVWGDHQLEHTASQYRCRWWLMVMFHKDCQLPMRMVHSHYKRQFLRTVDELCLFMVQNWMFILIIRASS